MSYCRWGSPKGSDVYVIRNVNGKYERYCRGEIDPGSPFSFESIPELIRHLGEHLARGHCVPSSALFRLETEHLKGQALKETVESTKEQVEWTEEDLKKKDEERKEEMNEKREFMSLREFLLLPGRHSPNSGWNVATSYPCDWIRLYDFAKESYEEFGDEGPPIGTRVVCLFAGHGGGPGKVRIIEKKEDDGTFVLREPGKKEGDHLSSSIVKKEMWWREIRIEKESDQRRSPRDHIGGVWTR